MLCVVSRGCLSLLNALAFWYCVAHTQPPCYWSPTVGFRACAAVTSRDGLADVVTSSAGVVLVTSLTRKPRCFERPSKGKASVRSQASHTTAVDQVLDRMSTPSE